MLHPQPALQTFAASANNGTLRRVVLNAEWFTTTEQAQIIIDHWLKQCNHTRPHQALKMRPPVPEILLEKASISGPETGG